MTIRELLLEDLHPILYKLQLEHAINTDATCSTGPNVLETVALGAPNAPGPVALVTPQERRFAFFMMCGKITH